MKQASSTIPAPPADLSPECAALWPGMVADLDAVGHGAVVDLSLLADVLRARDRLSEVTARLGVDGPTTTGSRGQMRPHPLLAMEASLRREIGAGFDRLGLSPKSRNYTTTVDDDGRIRRAS